MRILLRICCLSLIFFSSLFPAAAHEGAAAYVEADALTHVQATLSAQGVQFEHRAPEQRPPDGISGSWLFVKHNTDAFEAGTFAFVVPLKAPFAVDAALSFSEIISGHTLGVNIIIAFLDSGEETGIVPTDAETAGDVTALKGVLSAALGDFLPMSDLPENWVLSFVDIAKTPEEIVLRHGASGHVAPLGLIRPLAELLQTHEIPWSFHIRFNEIYTMGFTEGHYAVSTAQAKGISAFALTAPETGSAYADILGISPNDIAALLFEYVLSLDFPLQDDDRHYFFFTIPGGETIFFGQGFIAAVLLAVSAFCILLFLIYSVHSTAIFVFHARLFFKSIWLFFTLLAFLTISIMASGILYSTLFQFFGPSETVELSARTHFIGAALTIMLAVLIFFLHSPVFALLRIPRKPSFYGFSSVVFISMGLYSAALFDFSLVPSFLWASFFVFLAASFSKPLLVFICVLCLPLFALSLLYNIIETESTFLALMLTFPDWRSPAGWLAAGQAALFCLPIILLIKRGVTLARPVVFVPGDTTVRGYRLVFRLLVVVQLLAVVLAATLVHIILT